MANRKRIVTAIDSLKDYRIFVSYPRGGKAHTWAEAVQAFLQNEHARVWRDETGVQEGDSDWVAQIDSALRASDLLVAIVGMESEICRWQTRELLSADKHGTPIVALRVDDRAPVPFVLREKQPVEARPDKPATLKALCDALKRAALPPAAVSGASSVERNDVPAGQRDAEIVWLNNLLHGDLSACVDLYVPLEGIERSSTRAERALKKVRIPTDVILTAFGVVDTTIEPRFYSDVLDAYRDLGHRKIRRVAVLGEPGAGKSFSLERIALAYAERARNDAHAPIPLLVPLGLWTRDDEPLKAFIARQLENLGRFLPPLTDQRRAVLLLDAINEIPPGQRRHKAAQILTLAQDDRLASVVISCREKDFAEFTLPFDPLTLQPLSPPRVHDFLRRYYVMQRGPVGIEAADARFWLIAGGEHVCDAWKAWREAGAEAVF